VTWVDEEDGLGVSGGLEEGEHTTGEGLGGDEAMENLRRQVHDIVDGEGEGGRQCVNLKFAMLLPLWDEVEEGNDNEEDGEKRVRGVGWCREKLEGLLEVVVAGREEGVAISDLNLVSLGFLSMNSSTGGACSNVATKDSTNVSGNGTAKEGSVPSDGVVGESGEEVDVRYVGGGLKGQKMLEMALITLQNQGRVIRVRGLDHHRYVSSRWSNMWSLHREPYKSHKPPSSASASVANATVATDGRGTGDGKGSASAGMGGSRGNVVGRGKVLQGKEAGGSGKVSRTVVRGNSSADADSRENANGAVATPEEVADGEQGSAGKETTGAESVEEILVETGLGVEAEVKGLEERMKEALVDGQVAGPWLTIEGIDVCVC